MPDTIDRYAVLGNPIEHSKSPFIHSRFAEQTGQQLIYTAELVEAGDFNNAVACFAENNGKGLNITVPFKQDAWQLATQRSERAERAGAVNTLVINGPGDYFGDNTDGIGLVRDLAANHRIKLAGERILILGAGGAAAGILGSLLVREPAEVVLVNRNTDRAKALAERHGSKIKISVTDWTGLPALGCFDLLINATSLGHHGKAPPLTNSLFAAGSCCYDLNYYKASQPLKTWCENMGQAYVDGLGMLVEQAAESFSIWTGKQAETGTVIRAFESVAATPDPTLADNTD